MKWIRVVASVLVLVALSLSVVKVNRSLAAAPLSVPCNASALAASYHGIDEVKSVDSFGCVGHWAYLWATIGSGVHEVGVTDVLYFNSATASWENASRLKDCNPRTLPHYVEFWGCNSN
ncbi:MAG TPA: hypothetical protein VND89_07940 [Acidimicrobiales bacterium]|nr:hypothetical protein [Acidimicrobiales bacterium]